MAGPFDVFRRNQRSLLVAVAILAMLAFFVLPPILQQMEPSGGAVNTTVVRWTGGEFDEAGLSEAVTTRQIVNRFLALAAAEAGRDTSRLQLFMPETEEGVVQARLLRREAAEQGIVISDEAINDFLSRWTNNLVRPAQFDAILARLSSGPVAVTEGRLFEALRGELEARTMLLMSQTGYGSDTPGWRWDGFRRLEQSAIVEVVPITAESLAADVPAASEAKLRAFFEEHRESLPEPESPDPGFRSPHRIEAECLVALQKPFAEAAAKEVTDEQIQKYYDDNKDRLFRAAAKSSDDASAPGTEGAAEAAANPPQPSSATTGETEKSEPAKAEPDATKPEPATPEPSTPGEPATTEQKGDEQKGTEQKGAEQRPRSPFRFVADTDASPEAATPTPAADAKPPAPDSTTGKPGPDGDGAAPPSDGQKEAEPSYEPLDSVRDRIRDDLARGKAAARIEAIFSAVQADIARYSEDLALWQAKGEGLDSRPRAPDIDAIAAAQGLEARRTGVVDAIGASALAGLGDSFAFVPDPSSRFGVRQQSWLESMFGNENVLRSVVTDDAEGNRYLSWKTSDEPEHTPSFESAREGVEKAWRIVQARVLAMEKAKALAETAGGGAGRSSEPLEASLAGKDGIEVLQAGPFTWLDPGMVAFGGRPQVSRVPGLDLPGDEFMRAVFGLAPEGVAVAFNEPRTVCYCIRLVSLSPSEDDLRKRFLESRAEQGRLSAVTIRDFTTSYRDWIEGLDRKYAVTWKRAPRQER